MAIFQLMLSETTSWEGSLDELVAEVDRQLAPLDPEGRLGGVNARLIRYYLSIGALSKPGRTGREIRFQRRQVLECLLVRVLLGDGWPLAKIAELIRHTDDAGLIALLPAPRPEPGDLRQQAQALVARFQRQAATTGDASSALTAAAGATQARVRLRSDLQALGNAAGQVERAEVLKLRLASGCEVLLEPPWLQQLDEERIERAADAFRQVLREEFFKRGQQS